MDGTDNMTVVVNDNTARSRYELVEEGVLAGVEDYRLEGDRITLVHTEVFSEFAGRGFARLLVDHALEDARRRGLGVLPVCPYVRKVIARHPDAFLDLVPADARATFGLPQTSA